MNTISRRKFLAFGCCAAGAACCPFFVSSARAAVLDMAEVNRLFAELGATGKAPSALDAWLADPVAQKIAPYQAFDNVWQVGIAWVSSWAVKTDEGWVLIDTVHEPFVDVLLENLRTVGIAQDDIRLVLMTHGHFDHVGGYYRLKPLLKNARFVMTERGWNEAFRYARQSRGTASYMYDVHRNGRSYRAVTVGGQGLNAIEGPDQVRAYMKSMERLAENSLNIEVDLTAHPFSSGLADKIDAIRHLKPSDEHPLIDRAAYLARLKKLNEGAAARLKLELARAAV